MIEYAKIINEQTGLCEVGLGTNSSFYQSIGMVALDVKQSDIDNNWYLAEKCPMKSEEEKAREERERINLLSMTKREMFLGLYQAKQITPDMLKTQITDPAALIEFEYANDYYRGNPLIDVIGAQLGFTTEQLDRFFEMKDYHELLHVENEEKSNTNEIVLPDEHANGTEQTSDASSNSPIDLDEDTNVDN